MIRTDDWKLTRRFPDGPDELYNPAENPGEKANLYGRPAQAEVQARLQQRLDEFFARYAGLWKGGRSKAPLVVMGDRSRNRPATRPARAR